MQLRIWCWLTSWLGDPEQINGDDRCPTYLYRWIVWQTRWFKAYIHQFVGDDWSLDLHDHPKRFITVGLWGRYQEETPNGFRIYRAPWIRTFRADHRHRISLIDKRPCWTFVIVLKTVREWGFWHQGEFIEWRRYVWGDRKEVADQRKACAD